MSKSRKVKRAEETIKREIADIINKEIKVSNQSLVTVTNVECSPDLREAKFYVSIYEKDKDIKDKQFNKLKKQIKTIRYHLGTRISDWRYVPELTAKLDNSLQRVEKIEKLLEEDKKDN